MLVSLAEADRAPYPRRHRCPRLARSNPPSWSRCSAILRSVYVFLPPAHRGGRVIGTDALRILLMSREPSDGQERNQDNEDNPKMRIRAALPQVWCPPIQTNQTRRGWRKRRGRDEQIGHRLSRRPHHARESVRRRRSLSTIDAADGPAPASPSPY